MTEERVLVFVFTLDPSPWSYPPPVSFPGPVQVLAFFPKRNNQVLELSGQDQPLAQLCLNYIKPRVFDICTH